MIAMTKTQRTRLIKWCWQQSRVCNIKLQVNNSYDKELIFYTESGGHFWHTNRSSFMGNHDSMSIFGNFYCDNCSEIENLVNMTFSLQFFAFSPQKLIIGTQGITNNHLTFLVNVLFTLKHSFGLFPFQKFHNYSCSGLGCIPSQQQSVAALMSKRLTSILESLQIQIMVPSRF